MSDSSNPERDSLSAWMQLLDNLTSVGGTTFGRTAGEVTTILPDSNTTGSGEKIAQTTNQTLADTGEILDGRLAKVHRIVVERRIDTGSSMPDEQET